MKTLRPHDLVTWTWKEQGISVAGGTGVVSADGRYLVEITPYEVHVRPLGFLTSVDEWRIDVPGKSYYSELSVQ